MELFRFFSRLLFETRTVISPLPIHHPGRQFCSFSIFPVSTRIWDFTFNNIQPEQTYLMVTFFEDCEMGKFLGLTRHAGFTGNPIPSSGKNLPRVWDFVSYSFLAARIDIHPAPAFLPWSHNILCYKRSTKKLGGGRSPKNQILLPLWYSAFLSVFFPHTPMCSITPSRSWQRGTPTQIIPPPPLPTLPAV